MLLASVSVSAASEIRYERLYFEQLVKATKPDGSTAAASFVSEIILLPDGRAIGGFGLLEYGAPDTLSLYQVIEGRLVNRLGPFYEFKAKRLSSPTGDEITISLRPVRARHQPAQ